MVRFREFGSTPAEFVVLVFMVIFGFILGIAAMAYALGPVLGGFAAGVFIAWRALR